ncbi:hypothetical protein [Shinella granuli]|uniref:hypothetical protein n=1 Tax=Shinella granuli TaxID=323621 RepID=UPI0031E57C4F
MPKFNRSEIMKAAWAHYRRAQAYVASNPTCAARSSASVIALKAEWKRAKAQVAQAKLDAAVVARIDA